MNWQAGLSNPKRTAAQLPRPRAPIRCMMAYDHYLPPVFFLYLTGKRPPFGRPRAQARPHRAGASDWCKAFHASRPPNPQTDRDFPINAGSERNSMQSARPLICSLFRRRRRARRAPERRQQVGLALLDLGKVLLLDVAEAADLLGKAGYLQRDRMVPDIERGDDRCHRRLVVADQAP